jgi:MATE family multidrug resistance protein
MGVHRIDKAIRVVKQGLLLGIAFGPFVLICAVLARWFFSAVHSADLVEMETKYFHWIALGAWANILAAPLVGLFSGTSRTRTILVVDSIATVLNAVLDYLLIFGPWIFPELGIVGAALATSISLVFKLIVMLWIAGKTSWLPTKSELLKSTPKALSFFRSGWRLDPRMLSRLLFYGWPAAISSLAESISFTIIIILVGRLGTIYMEATTLALNVNLLAFIPMIGLGQAVGVLVGQRLTSGRSELARQSVRSGLTISLAYSMLFVIAYGLFPNYVLSIYAIGTEPQRFQLMRPIVLPLLWFIAAYCIFDAVQIVFVGALKGAGDTAFVLLGNLICGFTCVAAGKVIGDYVNGTLYWWWGVMMAWVVSLAMIFTLRYLHGGWLSKRVIEPELL